MGGDGHPRLPFDPLLRLIDIPAPTAIEYLHVNPLQDIGCASDGRSRLGDYAGREIDDGWRRSRDGHDDERVGHGVVPETFLRGRVRRGQEELDCQHRGREGREEGDEQQT